MTAGRRLKVTVPKPPAPAVEVRVDLDAGHFVGGVARAADGSPVAGVSIAPRLDGEYLDGIRAKTDGEGRFRLDGLPASGLSLEFYDGGVLRKEEPVPAVDREDLAVVLERHGSMAGTVVDGRTGEPIRDFRIRFGQPRLRESEQQGGGYSAQWVRGGKAFHDERGTFRIDEDVKVGGVFALEASAEGYGALVHDRVIVQLDPDPAALRFELFPGASIEGVVRERGSLQPIAGARLKAYASGRPPQPHEPNDDDGRPIAVSDGHGGFRLDNVGLGEVSILVEHPDWLPVTHGPIAVTAAAPVPAQMVLLDRGVAVTVDVRGADGRPLADAELVVVGRDVHLTGRSDATGTARIERVPPGEHELVLVQTGGAQRVWAFRRPLRVEHADSRVELVASDGDATLMVILESSEPLPADLQLWCMPANPAPAPALPFRARSALAQQGRTVIANLPAMELRVSLIADGWLGSSTVTTRAGATVEVRLTVQRMPARQR